MLVCAAPALAQDEGDEASRAAPGFLGVSMEVREVDAGDPPRLGVALTEVVPGSPAQRAGLERDDVILAVDGQPISGPKAEVLAALGARIREAGAGTTVSLTVRRKTVTVRTFLDEEPIGPATDASGVRAGREILPDLSRLLEEHPEALVGVRARSFWREREVEVVLEARPGTTLAPLPENSSLRPGLAKLPLGPAAALAAGLIGRAARDGVALVDVLTKLKGRFENDESRSDPFRLNTVRYLHRAPLRLPLATRALALGLRRAFRAPREGESQESGAAALLNTARLHLDAIASVDTEVAPRPPGPGASAEAHGMYAFACVELAERRVELAMAKLTADERTFLETNLPTLAEVFTRTIYLHTDEDQQRWDRHARAIKLMAKIDRGALIAALEALTAFAKPEYLKQMRADLLAAEAKGGLVTTANVRGRLLWVSEARGVVIGSSEDNEYRRDLKVVIDLGGDDRYHARVGVGLPGATAGLCVDVAGDDRYQSTVPHAQGAGFLGVGLLVDVMGDDHYTTNQSFAQGSALAGAGLLVDVSGEDVYRGSAYVQGAALVQGLGALVDLGGDDVVSAGLYSQGFAGPGAFGCLLARGGDDRYSALGREPCSYGDPGTYRAMSQGSAVGFRHQASGGIAILLDEGGDDLYEAGNFSQGGGYYYGWGALVDLGGTKDRYEGSRYAQGFAAHSALGSMWEDGGDDVYRGWVGAQNSAAWDLSVTSFLDEAGDDTYEPGPGFCLGASAHNGFSLFVDAGGEDTYRMAPGRAGPNTYHGGPSLSVFVDAGGGADVYKGGGLADGRLGVHPDTGIVIDLEADLEDVDLEALLPVEEPRLEAPESGD